MSDRLQQLGLGFIRVEGQWTNPEEPGSDPIIEESFAVVSNDPAIEGFAKAVIDVAADYEQYSVLIWSYEAQRGYVFRSKLSVKGKANPQFKPDDEWDARMNGIGWVEQKLTKLSVVDVEKAIEYATRIKGQKFTMERKGILHDPSSHLFERCVSYPPYPEPRVFWTLRRTRERYHAEILERLDEGQD